jgi:hypothetical protein
MNSRLSPFRCARMAESDIMQVQVDVWSDYVCPFCYLEQPVLDRIAQEYLERVRIRWRAFELRPDPVPALKPDGTYLHDIWARAVYPMAKERGMSLRLPPVQPESFGARAAHFAATQGLFDAEYRAFQGVLRRRPRHRRSGGKLSKSGEHWPGCRQLRRRWGWPPSRASSPTKTWR